MTDTPTQADQTAHQAFIDLAAAAIRFRRANASLTDGTPFCERTRTRDELFAAVDVLVELDPTLDQAETA